MVECAQHCLVQLAADDAYSDQGSGSGKRGSNKPETSSSYYGDSCHMNTGQANVPTWAQPIVTTIERVT